MKRSMLSRFVMFSLVVFVLIQVGCAGTAQGAGQLLQGIGKDVESWGEPQRNNHDDYRHQRNQEVRQRLNTPQNTSY